METLSDGSVVFYYDNRRMYFVLGAGGLFSLIAFILLFQGFFLFIKIIFLLAFAAGLGTCYYGWKNLKKQRVLARLTNNFLLIDKMPRLPWEDVVGVDRETLQTRGGISSFLTIQVADEYKYPLTNKQKVRRYMYPSLPLFYIPLNLLQPGDAYVIQGEMENYLSPETIETEEELIEE